MQALQYRDLPDIDNVHPINTNDRVCFDEVKEVLEKHGMVKRFGLCLLHNHFNLAEDEVMSETCDDDTRTLTIRPVKASKVGAGKTIETTWRLDTMEAQLCCHKHGPQP